jgi:hypothetical protein
VYQRNPIDQARERTEQGGQPFKDAKDTFRQEEAELDREGHVGDEGDEPSTEDERTARQEDAASQRFQRIAAEETRSGPNS